MASGIRTRTAIKTGVRIGGGEAPGYQWNCLYLSVARDEAMQHLTEPQYHHLVDQLKEMAYLDDPTRAPHVDVRAVEEFYELRDKGGPLGKSNMRVFFGVYGAQRNIVVFGTTKKEQDGKTPTHVVVRIRRRMRAFENGIDASG